MFFQLFLCCCGGRYCWRTKSQHRGRRRRRPAIQTTGHSQEGADTFCLLPKALPLVYLTSLRSLASPRVASHNAPVCFSTATESAARELLHGDLSERHKTFAQAHWNMPDDRFFVNVKFGRGHSRVPPWAIQSLALSVHPSSFIVAIVGKLEILVAIITLDCCCCCCSYCSELLALNANLESNGDKSLPECR